MNTTANNRHKISINSFTLTSEQGRAQTFLGVIARAEQRAPFLCLHLSINDLISCILVNIHAPNYDGKVFIYGKENIFSPSEVQLSKKRAAAARATLARTLAHPSRPQRPLHPHHPSSLPRLTHLKNSREHSSSSRGGLD